jgi:hypothetical protein
MICIKCGTQNDESAKFCVKCGNPMNNENILNNSQSAINNGNLNNPSNNLQPETTINNNNINNINSNSQTEFFNTNLNNNNNINQNAINQSNEKMTFSEYMSLIVSVLLKPFSALKNNYSKLQVFKNSLFLALIVTFFATIVSLIKTIITTVHPVSSSFFSKNSSTWNWSYLKYINFFKTISTDILIFLGIIFAIACVYYIASLIVKKQISFSKMVGIAALAVIPIYLAILFASPILSLINENIGPVVVILGGVYTFIILYESMNSEINLNGDVKYYFNLICISILIIAGYFIYSHYVLGSISGYAKSIFDLLG